MDNHLVNDMNIGSEITALEELEEMEIALQKRYAKRENDILSLYTDEDFKQKFQFSKETVLNHLLPLISIGLDIPQSNRGLPIPSATCLLAALRFFVTGNMATVRKEFSSMSQGSMSRILFRVSNKLASFSRKYIKFPQDLERLKQDFKERTGLSDVVGCIGCTHVKLKTGDKMKYFLNPMGTYSFNVQTVCGPNLEIFDIVARWSGCVNDIDIFEKSSVKKRMDHGEIYGAIVGNINYPVLPYLRTPNCIPDTEEEGTYNIAHFKARCMLQRCFAVWKGRFACLQHGLANKYENIPAIIVACAVLHNIGILYEDDFIVEENEIPNIKGNIGYV